MGRLNKKLENYVVDPSSEVRTLLKQFLLHLPEYAKPQLYANFKFANLALEAVAEEPNDYIPAKPDVVFVSGNLPHNDVKDWIFALRQRPECCCTVFIVLIEEQDGHIRSLAEALVVGGHAILQQPFSVDDVKLITERAIDLRAELEREKNERAVEEAVREAMHWIDAASLNIVLEGSPGHYLLKLREVARTIAVFKNELLEMYFKVMIDTFERSPLPRFLPGPENYTGKSVAMRKRAAKHRKEIEDIRKSGGSAPRKKRSKAVERGDGSVTPP